MSLHIVLIIVLGLALIAAVTTLVVTEVRAMRPTRPRQASAHVAGCEALDVIDSGLRHLVAQCERSGRELPDLYAVGYVEERLTVRLAGADQVAPAPWAASPSGEEWTLEPRALIGADIPPDAPTRYALVVTIGTDQGERILVDLGRSSAPVSVGGDGDGARSLLRGMLAELVTGPVSRRAEVTLVGAVATASLTGPDLHSDRLHTATTLEEAVRGGADAAPRAAAHVTQVFRQIEGRRPGSRAGGRRPRLFVLEAARLPEERQWVEGLEDSDGLLVVGDAPDASLRFRVGADGALDTGALGVRIDTHAGRLRSATEVYAGH